jgi:hypothetical protein
MTAWCNETQHRGQGTRTGHRQPPAGGWVEQHPADGSWRASTALRRACSLRPLLRSCMARSTNETQPVAHPKAHVSEPHQDRV